MSATCRVCHRTLAPGETAWASEWKVIKVDGTDVGFVTETRYTCDTCEDQP